MAIKNSQTEIDYVKQMESNKIPFRLKLVRRYIRLLNLVSEKKAAKYVAKLFLTPQRKTLRDEQLVYYDSGETKFIKFNGKEVFVFTKGDGPRIMLAHGWGSNSYLFRSIIDGLVASGFSIVTIDYPGHGQSGGKQTTLVETSELVKEISENYGPFKGIIGYSFGGPTALRALELGVQTENLILLSAPTRIESIFDPFFDLLDINSSLQESFFDELIRQTGINKDRISPVEMDFNRTIRSLIIHDKDDEIIPIKDAEAINNELQNSRLIITSNLGHRGIPRSELIVSEIVNFINTSDIKIETMNT